MKQKRPGSQKKHNNSHARSERRVKNPSSRGLKAPPGTTLVMGRHCISEILKYEPGRFRGVFVAERRDFGEAADGRRADLINRLEKHGVSVSEVPKHELSDLVGSESHQGFVGLVSVRPVLSLDALVKRAKEQQEIGILALDGVLDPQNMGAILRAAECFGVSAVLFSRNRSADVGPVIAKASVGASELIDLCPVGNLHQAIERLKAVGVWSIGAVVSPEAKDLASFESPEKWVLVMGSEGTGIQRLIGERLDFSIYIPMQGRISSLNVSQATAVFLSRLSESATALHR